MKLACPHFSECLRFQAFAAARSSGLSISVTSVSMKLQFFTNRTGRQEGNDLRGQPRSAGSHPVQHVGKTTLERDADGFERASALFDQRVGQIAPPRFG